MISVHEQSFILRFTFASRINEWVGAMTRKLNCHNVYTRNPLSLENFEGYATKGNDLAFLLKIRRNSWKPFERLASRLYINHSSSLLFDRDRQSNRGGN